MDSPLYSSMRPVLQGLPANDDPARFTRTSGDSKQPNKPWVRQLKDLEEECSTRGPAGLAFQTSGFWNLDMIFGEGQNFQTSDGPSESPPKFERRDLGRIDADLCR